MKLSDGIASNRMRLVLDASVAIAAVRPSEPKHLAARARILRFMSDADLAVVPALFIVEVRGALAQLGFDRESFARWIDALTRPPHEVVTLGPRAAKAAGDIAARYKIRGPDACYVWLARREAIPLCTLDVEMAARGKTVCTVVEP
jgi:predicted nucleic acid-binding protein